MTDQEKRCKPLSEEERQKIQDCLDPGMSFKQIARRIGRDQKTVAKEVKKHKVSPPRSEKGAPESICQKRMCPPFVCNGCKRTARCQQERHFYIA